MAKKIGNLAVFVSANTAGLSKGMAKAGRVVTGFKSSVNSAGSAIATGIGGVLVAAAAAGAAAYGLKSVADSIDNTAKTADALGVTTEALIGLRHAADLGGLGAEGMDEALTTMTKNVGLAAQGSGKAKAALEALGFDLQHLSEVSPENQIKAIADALETVQNPTEKVALSMKIFGDSGAKMINVLQGGSKALEDQQAEAKQLGLVFDRLSAAKVEIMNDDLTRMWETLKGAAQTLVIELAPYVDAGINAFVEWAKQGNGFGDTVVSAVHWVASAVAFLADTVDLVSVGWTGMKYIALKVFEAILDGVHNLIEGVHDFTDVFSSFLPDSVSKGLDSASNAVASFANEIGASAEDAGKQLDEKLIAKSSGEKVDEFFSSFKHGMDAQAKAIADRAPKAQAYTKELQDQLHTTNVNTDALNEQVDAAQKLKDINFGDNSLITAGSAQAQNFTATAIGNEIARVFQKQIDQQKEANKSLKDIASNTAKLGDEETFDL